MKKKLLDLNEWLQYITKTNAKEIDLGLTRIKHVAQKIGALKFDKQTIILIGGTNGKGSCVAFLEQIYLAAGFKVGCFTSPYILDFTEQIRINGKDVNSQDICDTFENIENNRGKTLLTKFEYTTLAALKIFQKYKSEIIILEVGMGGATDATNIIEPDLSIITNIELEHTNWLGNTREEIGLVKAGIMRPNKPAIFGANNPPKSLINFSDKISAKLFLSDKDFTCTINQHFFSWKFKHQLITLPIAKLSASNAAIALTAVAILQDKLPVKITHIEEGIKNASLLGRYQIIAKPVIQIFDVAHNPASIRYLAQKLQDDPCEGKTLAVFSMLNDKNILDSILAINGQIDSWFIAELNTERAVTLETLKKNFQKAKIDNYQSFKNLEEAYYAALKSAHFNDRIIVFGSFFCAAEILKLFYRQTTKTA